MPLVFPNMASVCVCGLKACQQLEARLVGLKLNRATNPHYMRKLPQPGYGLWRAGALVSTGYISKKSPSARERGGGLGGKVSRGS